MPLVRPATWIFAIGQGPESHAEVAIGGQRSSMAWVHSKWIEDSGGVYFDEKRVLSRDRIGFDLLNSLKEAGGSQSVANIIPVAIICLIREASNRRSRSG